MDPAIQKLCEDIKRLVPPSKPADPTDQLTAFLGGLKQVNPKDLDAIGRAYNYFNRMLGAPLVKVVAPVTLANASQNVSNDQTQSGDNPNVSVKVETPNEVISTDEAEMIDILVRVAEGATTFKESSDGANPSPSNNTSSLVTIESSDSNTSERLTPNGDQPEGSVAQPEVLGAKPEVSGAQPEVLGAKPTGPVGEPQFKSEQGPDAKSEQGPEEPQFKSEQGPEAKSEQGPEVKTEPSPVSTALGPSLLKSVDLLQTVLPNVAPTKEPTESEQTPEVKAEPNTFPPNQPTQYTSVALNEVGQAVEKLKTI